MEAKEYNKKVKLQYNRLKKVLDELEVLEHEELISSNGEEHQGKRPITPAKYAVFNAMSALKLSYGLIDSSDEHQEIAVLVNVCEGRDVTDIKLMSKVKRILLPYPFRIDHAGSQNVYEIKPTDSLLKLLKQVKEVFTREYALGNCVDSHNMRDFYIEHITVHKNDCASIYIGA